MDNSVVEEKQKDIQDKPNIQAIDVHTVCRACLAQSDEVENIFKVFTAEMFYFCTSVKISETDGMPDSLCQQCFWLLNRVYYFKQLVLRSNTVLKQGIQVKVLADVGSIKIGVTTANLLDNSPEKDKNDSPSEEAATDNDSNVADPTPSSGQSDTQNKISLPLQVTKTKPVEGRKAFKCPKCGKATHDYEILALHLNMHLDEKMKKLKKLKRAKPPKPLNYTCNICGETLKTAATYKLHMKRRHTGIKNLLCPVCGKAFVLKGDMNNHMNSHTDLKPYKCEICDKSFKTKAFVKVHYRTHTGEKPCECEFCQRRFKDPRTLRQHLLIHTSDRPHRCEICERRFISNATLRKHLTSHAPKVKKPIKYYEMLPTAERPHECEICHRSFKLKRGLGRHMTVTHNIQQVKQNKKVQDNKNKRREFDIDFARMDEVVPNIELPINKQLQYAIMKVCSDINKPM